MNGAESQTAASASPLVGPYPIDEEALRKLKRFHGARGQRGPMLLDILCQQPRTTTNLRFTQYFGGKLAFAAIMINLRARARMLV